MIEVKDGQIRIEGSFERTYREIEEILMEYRKYLEDLRGETMISNLMLSQMIGRILKENA